MWSKFIHWGLALESPMKPLLVIVSLLVSVSLANPVDHLAIITKKSQDPETHLKDMGPWVIMGNSSLNDAKVVFLPEVHDDPQSLTAQLLLIAQEKQKNQPFLVLDESLASMKKSIWDIFSQKSLEIMAAIEQRQNSQKYAPRHFEKTLQTLANKFKNQGDLSDSSDLWTLTGFSNNSTPFFGWDSLSSKSLTERNIQMVKSIKNALKKNDRILVMAGARHIPELEHLSSQKLLCNGEKFKDIKIFFQKIKRNFGDKPELKDGIGATLPIYDFLSTTKYAVVFNKDFVPELNKVINQFKIANQNHCIKL
jgi:hypothetical protein